MIKTSLLLFQQQLLLDEAEASLLKILEFSLGLSITAIIGVPLACENRLFNCAAVIQKGRIYGIVPKTFLPNYREFYEQHWFTSAAMLGESVSHPRAFVLSDTRWADAHMGNRAKTASSSFLVNLLGEVIVSGCFWMILS